MIIISRDKTSESAKPKNKKQEKKKEEKKKGEADGRTDL
jgi:hypothetical protein